MTYSLPAGAYAFGNPKTKPTGVPSARRAIANRQRVLYVTERCVLGLTPRGLRLLEVYPGIDPERDVLPHLPFEIEM